MGGSGRYPGTSIESSMWSGRYQVLQKYPEPDPEPGYLGSGRHRVAKPGRDVCNAKLHVLVVPRYVYCKMRREPNTPRASRAALRRLSYIGTIHDVVVGRYYHR